MKKMNNKGYMLVEIIVAFSIGFMLLYFMMDLVIKLKNKNDDLVIDTIIKTDQTIISNKILEHIIKETKDPENITFSCDKIEVDTNNQTVKYNDELITIVDNTAKISYNHETDCSIENGKVSIKIPVDVKQMPDKDYDIKINYRYKLMECNPTKSYKCTNETVGNEPYSFTYTGNCEVEYEGSCNWKIKFKTTGTLKFNSNVEIDAFLVGGGGSGSKEGHGGGGGYTTTEKNINLVAGEPYNINIGNGGIWDNSDDQGVAGETTTAFDVTANGGSGGNYYWFGGGQGGSGGGAGTDPFIYPNSSIPQYAPAPGGVDGGNGGNSDSPGGEGQGTTTREFGETTGDLYATGGDGFFIGIGKSKDGMDNTGNGGSGGGGSYLDDNGQIKVVGNGGSGIVVIRNHIEFEPTIEIENSNLKFGYNGQYKVEGNGDNWRIKFLNDGEFIVDRDVEIDIFLVGGGGGGSSYGSDYRKNGGGGGRTTTVKGINIKAGQIYKIDVGSGGSVGRNGKASIVFDKDAEVLENAEGEKANADGGEPGATGGGSGGSGGGGGGENGGSGGINGGAGGNFGGKGQESTTCEFNQGKYNEGCDDGITMYASGGAGAGSFSGNGINGTDNTGDGGGGAGETGVSGIGGSGIIIIRKAK